jgi:hypothetical protein
MTWTGLQPSKHGGKDSRITRPEAYRFLVLSWPFLTIYPWVNWIPTSIIRKHLLYTLEWLKSGVGVLFLFVVSS